mmetsp:Transcript_4272/g.15366  ORF Transcript_4272/g.15366 Transcript_4272/m.15366 type:complete len:289 (+) Transcript_4272:860-1726(+)
MIREGRNKGAHLAQVRVLEQVPRRAPLALGPQLHSASSQLPQTYLGSPHRPRLEPPNPRLHCSEVQLQALGHLVAELHCLARRHSLRSVLRLPLRLVLLRPPQRLVPQVLERLGLRNQRRRSRLELLRQRPHLVRRRLQPLVRGQRLRSARLQEAPVCLVRQPLGLPLGRALRPLVLNPRPLLGPPAHLRLVPRQRLHLEVPLACSEQVQPLQLLLEGASSGRQHSPALSVARLVQSHRRRLPPRRSLSLRNRHLEDCLGQLRAQASVCNHNSSKAQGFSGPNRLQAP